MKVLLFSLWVLAFGGPLKFVPAQGEDFRNPEVAVAADQPAHDGWWLEIKSFDPCPPGSTNPFSVTGQGGDGRGWEFNFSLDCDGHLNGNFRAGPAPTEAELIIRKEVERVVKELTQP